MKHTNKAMLISEKALGSAIMEREILESICNPFVMSLRFAFQDERSLFIICDLMFGGSLDFHLSNKKIFTESEVKFYAAEVGLGLNYLHGLGIIHRDVKPENILIDEDGHVRIGDYNAAVMVPSEAPFSSERVGTLSYMAPEAVLGLDYSFGVDWWSLGVLLLQLTSGKNVFYDQSRGATRENIVERGEFTIDSRICVSPEFYDFLTKLLVRNPRNRLGNGGLGFEAVKTHPFFKDLSWDLIEKKKVVSPFVPNKKKANYSVLLSAEEMFKEKTGVPNVSQAEYEREELLSGRRFQNYDYTEETEERRARCGANRLKEERKKAKTALKGKAAPELFEPLFIIEISKEGGEFEK
eukprot:GHVN01038102.1.p1 GENE.GHVN01038102.1~~GHVN01038102.1.p1  ORF type:complete len:402 (+),score=47.75 GHVN01038102.1:150-1208(+)